MSARSSVQRQSSQESDANNNIGSTFVNGQGPVSFVIPNMQQSGTSYPNSYNAAAAQQFQRGANQVVYQRPQGQTRLPPMSTSAPSAGYPTQVPVIHGSYVVRHQTTGIPQYTVGLDAPPMFPQGNQFPPDPMTSPPPAASSVPFYLIGPPAGVPYGAQFAVNPPYAQQFLLGNGGQLYYQQQQPQQQPPVSTGFGIAQAANMDYGQLQQVSAAGQMQPPPQAPTPVPAVSVQQNNASQLSGVPQEPSYQVPTNQQPPPASQQQTLPRKKQILTIINPETQENVMESAIKEKEEEDRHKHQHYVGGLWKPPPDVQKQQLPTENPDRRPSRDQTPAPGADVAQNETSQDVLNFYNAVIGAATADTKLDSPPPTATQHSDRVILPPTTQGYTDSSSQLQFGVDPDEQKPTTIVSNVGLKQTKETGKQEIQFGWNPAMESENKELDGQQIGSRSVSKSPAPAEDIGSHYEQSATEDSTPQDGSSNMDVSHSPDDTSETEMPPPSSGIPQMHFESPAEESEEIDGSSLRGDNESSKFDDSLLDQSMASSMDERSTDVGQGDEITNLKSELERYAEDTALKRYGHEFMLLAQKLPASKEKPEFNTTKWSQENMDDVFNLRKRHPSQTKPGSAKFSPMPGGGGQMDFNTAWMKVAVGGPPGRKQYPGRSSDSTGARGRGRGNQGGRGSQMKQPPIILGAPAADVELKHAENAWKPGMKKVNVTDDPEKAETEKLFKETRGILNKITPQTLDDLSQEFLNLEPRMNTADRASGVVDIVFQKAVDEPKFCTMYSDLYDRVTRYQLLKQQQQQGTTGTGPTKGSTTAMNRETNFRFILLTKCQAEFDNVKKVDAWKKEREAAIAAAETPEQKTKLQEEMDEMWGKAKRQMLGNMRFIGELYLRNMLTAKIMHHCVTILCGKSSLDEEALECLCNLLSTIGKKLESDKALEFPGSMDKYFKVLQDLLNTQSPRLKFMILDLMDLRRNGWVPRRKGEGPKTIDQLHQDAHIEKLNEQILIEQHELKKQQEAEDSPTRGSQRRGRKHEMPQGRGSYGPSDRHDHDNRGARASMGREQGRQHGPGSQQMHVPESSSKFKQPSLSQHLEPTAIKLGPPRQGWSKGAGVTSSPSAPSMSATLPRAAHQDPAFRTANRFDQLSMAEDRRQSVGSASSSRESSQTRYDEKRKALDNVRQIVGGPAAASKPTERRDGSATAPRSEQSEEGASSYVDEEKLRRYASELIDELVDTNDFKEALILIADRKSATDRIVAIALGHVLEKKEKHRIKLGELIARLYAVDGRSAEITKGFALFVRNSIEDDLAQDVPQIWAYVGQILAVALLASDSAAANTGGKRLMLNEFRDAFREAGDSKAAELLAQTLLAVRRESSSDDTVMDVYRSITDRSSFLNDQSLEVAFRKHKLDSLLSLPSPATSAGSSSTLPGSRSDTDDKRPNVRIQMPASSGAASTFPYGLASPGAHSAMLREPLDGDIMELERLVQSGDKLAVDQLIEFIKSKGKLEDESQRSMAFLGALVKSLCAKVVVCGDLDDSYVVDAEELERCCKVLEKFVTSNRRLEIKTLDALADYYYNLNCPQGLLVNILDHFQDLCIIETDSFMEWWSRDHGVISSNGELKAWFLQFADLISDPEPDPESEQDT